MKDQLGHHSIKVTVDVYGHLVPGANKAAVDRLDQQALAAMTALEARKPAQPRATWSLPNTRAGSRSAP